MKRYALSLILVVVCASNLLAQSTAVQVFDVRRYGATGNGTTSDTTAINNAIIAAEAVGNGAVVEFPRGTYATTGLLQAAGGDIQLIGEGAVIKQIADAGGTNQMLYIGADDVTVKGIEFDGNYPTVTPAGEGIGINVGAFENITIERCYVHNTKGIGINSATLARDVEIASTRVIEAGTDAINVNSDETVISGCDIRDWGVVDASSNRAIQVDGQNADLDSLEILDTKIRMTVTGRNFTDAILIDCGDGDFTTGDPILFGNGGAATEDGDDSAGAAKSYIQYKLDAGHGFQVGDMVWIDNSSVGAAYNDIAHTIRSIGGTGNVFIAVVDSNTITLHPTADEARAGTGAIDLTSTGSGTFYITSYGANRVAVTASSGVNTSNEQITCTSHGFQTGEMARLTVLSTASTRSNTATGGSSTTITLDASASAADDTYNGSTIYVTSGTGIGSIGHCTDYVGATKVATVSSWSSTAPAASSGFAIRANSLPIGLADAGTLTFNTVWDSVGGAGTSATYMRPKRINHVTMRGVTIEHASPDGADCNAIKVNNVNDLHFIDVHVNQTPDISTNENSSIRLGQGLRKVQLSECHLGGKLIVNNITWIPELKLEGCVIGDGANWPEVAMETIGCTRLTVRNSTLRFSLYGIRNVGTGQHSDDKVESWAIHDNVFEAFRSTRAQVFSFQTGTDFDTSGLIGFYNNERRNVHPSYAGLSISSVTTTAGVETLTMSTHHQLKSGDLVQMRTTGSVPGGTTQNAWYFVRKQGNTTLTLHTSLANVSSDTRVDLTSSGSTSTLWSPRIGVQFSGNGFRDLYYMNQSGDNPREIFNEAIPTSANYEWKAGDRILKMDPASGKSPGWICTATGSPGTWKPMSPTGFSTLDSDTTEVGNVGTGVDDLISYTLPANTLVGAGDRLEIEAGFTFAANGNNKQVKLLIDGTEHYASGAVAQNAGSMVLKMTVICDSATVTKFSSTVQTTGSGAIPNVALVNGGLLTITAANIIKCTGEATSNNDIVQEYMTVQYIPAP